MVTAEQFVGVASLKAGADLSAKECYFVKVNSDGEAVLAGNGNKALGVIQEGGGAVENSWLSVVYSGIVRVLAGGTIAAGDSVTSNAAGKAIAVTTLTATTPTGAVAVLSSGAQPAMTLAGGTLPQEINGIALTGGDEDDYIYVALK
jgi:hypothetical protein